MPNRSKLLEALSWLRSILILNNLIYLYTIVLGTCSLIVSLFESSGRIQHQLARAWSWLILKTIAAPVTVEGLQHIRTDRPHLYAFNHLSAVDIPLLYVHLPFQFRIIAKRELFRYPFLGWHLKRSGQVSVDPADARASMRALIQGADSLRQGMPLVVFPEGGRTSNGQIKPFMSGAFYIAIKAGVDIVPGAIIGTYEMLPMNHFHIRPRPLRMIFGEPISTDGYSLRTMESLAAKVQRAVEDLYYPSADVPDPRTAEHAAVQPQEPQ